MNRQAPPLKTYSHLAGERRVPSEYEIVTTKLLYHPQRGFEVDVPLKSWYARYQRDGRLRCADWEQFADPRATTYASYTALQARQESHLDGVLRSWEAAEHEPALLATWGETFSRVLAPLRFALHGLQMIAAYVGQMAPAGRLTIAALLQSADELRRVHRLAYHMGLYRRLRPGPDHSRAAWREDPAWQPLRRTVEQALVTYDWGEALVALNLGMKPLVEALFFTETARLAREQRDFLLGEVLSSLDEDSRWHQTWSAALIQLLAPEGDNRAVLRGWVERWWPRGREAVGAAAPLLGELGSAALARAEARARDWLRGLELGGAMTGLPSPTLIEQLLASGSDGLVAYDAELRCLFWNPAMEQITGMKGTDVLGQILPALFPFLTEIGEDQNMRAALAGKELSSRNRPFHVPGTRRHGFFDGQYRPLRDEEGQVVGGIAVIRDVTDRTLAEEQLRETETRFRNMADVSPVLLWLAETDGMCTFFNQTWLRFTGRTLEEEWGVGWAEGVHFEDFQRCMDTFIESFNARRVFEMEYRLRRADGEFRWVLDRGTPRYTGDGRFAGYIGSCVDITERKAAEAELRRAVQVRDQFLSVASHELRTPLTPLQLQIDRLDRLLHRDPRGQIDLDEVSEMALMVKSQVGRMTELVDVLLDVSRVTYGPLHLDRAELDAADLVRQTVERWRPAATTAGCRLDLRLDGPVLVSADRLRLEQLLNNLLSNAIKYGARNPVEVELFAEPELLRLQVRDHGIGVPLADQERIFERFERAAPVENYGGLGLGLWISRQIVEAMGGDIRVESAPERGARFLVELPRQHRNGVNG